MLPLSEISDVILYDWLIQWDYEHWEFRNEKWKEREQNRKNESN